MAYYVSLVVIFPLDKDHRLRVGYLETAAATGVFARQHIVQAHHVIARIIVPRAIVRPHTARRRVAFDALHPADVIIIALAAMRAGKVGAFGFLSFVKDVTFLQHNRNG